MKTQQETQKRQEEVLEAMASIHVMRRGTVSRQEYAVRRRHKRGKGAVGPYFLWQGSVKGKRFGKRVGAEEAERFAQEIEQRRKFERLAAEYIELGEAIAQSLHVDTGPQEAIKKGLKSRSSRARK